jgi:hypothetical protein
MEGFSGSRAGLIDQSAIGRKTALCQNQAR